MAKTITSPEATNELELVDISLRPQWFSEFLGQGPLKKNLKVFIEAAKRRSEPLDHLLFYGPPGLGKTTLCYVTANELGSRIQVTSGPALKKAGHLAAILTNLKEGDILFIDEIHRIPVAIEEVLYPAMEDFVLDLVVGDGPAARVVQIKLAHFTLVGATTKIGCISKPLQNRFGIVLKLDLYEFNDLELIISQAARKLSIKCSPEAIYELAVRSRGTPRIALRLLRRLRDFAEIAPVELISAEFAVEVLQKLGVDTMGLDDLDRLYIAYIANSHKGGPVGIDTIVAALSEDKETIESIVESYLIQIGFLQKSSRGRILSSKCLQYLKEKIQD